MATAFLPTYFSYPHRFCVADALLDACPHPTPFLNVVSVKNSAPVGDFSFGVPVFPVVKANCALFCYDVLSLSLSRVILKSV